MLATNPFLDGTFLEQRTVFKNSYCAFVMTPQPILKGSGLIVSKTVRETVFDVAPEEWAATFDLLQQANAYLDEIQPDGYTIGWNVGTAGGKTFLTSISTLFQDLPMSRWQVKGCVITLSNRRIDAREGFYNYCTGQ